MTSMDEYLTIDDCVKWLFDNEYSNDGLDYTYQHIARCIREFIEVDNLSKESFEQEQNESQNNRQINMYTYMKSFERVLGDFKIKINVTDENETYYTTDTSVSPSCYTKTKAGVSRYLVNESFIRALDFYLENSDSNSSSEIVFKSSDDIFKEIKDLDREQLISYVDMFIEDLLIEIRIDMFKSLVGLRRQEMARLNLVLDRYRLSVNSPTDKIIDQCNFFMNIAKNEPLIWDTLFNKFKVTIQRDIRSDQNFEHNKNPYSKRMNRFLRDSDKIYNSRPDDEEYILLKNEELTKKLEKALKKRAFRKYIRYFYIQSHKLRNKMNEEIKGQIES